MSQGFQGRAPPPAAGAGQARMRACDVARASHYLRYIDVKAFPLRLMRENHQEGLTAGDARQARAETGTGRVSVDRPKSSTAELGRLPGRRRAGAE